MSNRQFDRECDQLDRDLMNGVISNAEHSKELREMQRAYQAAAEEAAMDAYEREMGNW